MAKYGNARMAWVVRGKRHIVISIIAILLGPLLGVLVAGGLLSVQNTANTVHLSTVQDVIGTVALTLGCVITAVFVIFGVRRLNRYAVGGTNDLLIIASKWRIPIPIGAVSRVVVVGTEGDESHHEPGVVLIDNRMIRVPNARSRKQSNSERIIDVDDVTYRPAELDRTWEVAMEIRSHLPNALSSTTFSQPIPATNRAGRLELTATPPSDAIVKLTIRDLGNKRRLPLLVPFYVIIAGFFALQTQQGTDHPFNAAQFILSYVAIVLLMVCLLAVPLSQMIKELQVGPDWLATRRNLHRKWRVVRADAIVCIALLAPAKRSKSLIATTLSLSDEAGVKTLLPKAWLTQEVSSRLISAFGNVPFWVSSARESISSRAAQN